MVKLLDLINKSFNGRREPNILTNSEELSQDEYSEVLFFKNKHWSTITCDEIQIRYEVLFWFSSEAFCYYLPGILTAGIKEEKTDLLIYDALISMLDRSPNISYWDNFFINRWRLLSKKELEAIEEWVLWLESHEEINYSNNTFVRVFDTLELLKANLLSCPNVPNHNPIKK